MPLLHVEAQGMSPPPTPCLSPLHLCPEKVQFCLYHSAAAWVQGISLDQVEPLRILFGWFPTYKDSPLKTPFDRVLQIGDASGIQSPLSFGGFGAMARHLCRLRRAVQEALQVCCVMPCLIT